MSYILDALQRAELERERASGTVPGLQTRSIATPTATQKESFGARNWWLVFAAIALLAIAAISFMLWRQAPVSTPLVSSPLATSPATAPVATSSPAPAATAAPSAAPPVAPAASPVAAAVAMASVASATVTAPEPISVKPLSPAAAPASAVRAKAEVAESVVVPAPVPKPASEAPTPTQRSASALQAPKANLPLLKDLPEAIRAQMPPLSVSGVVYSDNPAQRLLLLNGQVLPQGSRVADDLVLDEIHPKSSDFTFRGTRFKLSH
jgi:general secretion pathway protein B